MFLHMLYVEQHLHLTTNLFSTGAASHSSVSAWGFTTPWLTSAARWRNMGWYTHGTCVLGVCVEVQWKICGKQMQMCLNAWIPFYTNLRKMQKYIFIYHIHLYLRNTEIWICLSIISSHFSRHIQYVCRRRANRYVETSMHTCVHVYLCVHSKWWLRFCWSWQWHGRFGKVVSILTPVRAGQSIFVVSRIFGACTRSEPEPLFGDREMRLFGQAHVAAQLLSCQNSRYSFWKHDRLDGKQHHRLDQAGAGACELSYQQVERIHVSFTSDLPKTKSPDGISHHWSVIGGKLTLEYGQIMTNLPIVRPTGFGYDQLLYPVACFFMICTVIRCLVIWFESIYIGVHCEISSQPGYTTWNRQSVCWGKVFEVELGSINLYHTPATWAARGGRGRSPMDGGWRISGCGRRK